MGLCVLGVHMHAELEITHPDSPCLLPETFSFGEAPCSPPAPGTGIALWEKRTERAQLGGGCCCAAPRGASTTSFHVKSPEARMHAPKLQTALMLKVHMP